MVAELSPIDSVKNLAFEMRNGASPSEFAAGLEAIRANLALWPPSPVRADCDAVLRRLLALKRFLRDEERFANEIVVPELLDLAAFMELLPQR